MKKFSKKGPDTIEATQFDPHEQWHEAVRSWGEGPVPRDMSWGYIDRPGEGKIHICAGDWIFKDEHGMWDAMRNDIFKLIYEPAE